MKIAILGAGMVGRAIALDLSRVHEITSFDIDRSNLELLRQRNLKIQVQEADLGDFGQYKKWFESFELVVSAVPGFMGYRALEAVINAGKSVADISFFPENALDLDSLAREKKVTAITDIGVAPGMSNLILGRYDQEMGISHFECYVGGLPLERRKPFEYKAPFSPIDVLEEYTRPARQKENGFIITKAPLSEVEDMQFESIGTLEAFNTDGLRSLLYTMKHIPNLKEKTLRYPGHASLILALKQAGFFSKEKLAIAGGTLVPMEATAAILMRDWKSAPEEKELTVMKVLIRGVKNDKPSSIDYNLVDYYEPATKTSSMARTTGYTCAAAAELLAQGLFDEKGVFPPELLGKNRVCFDFVINYLAHRGVKWEKHEY